jgi:hypothetical protein
LSSPPYLLVASLVFGTFISATSLPCRVRHIYWLRLPFGTFIGCVLLPSSPPYLGCVLYQVRLICCAYHSLFKVRHIGCVFVSSPPYWLRLWFQVRLIGCVFYYYSLRHLARHCSPSSPSYIISSTRSTTTRAFHLRK